MLLRESACCDSYQHNLVTVHMLQYPRHNNTETGQPLPCIPSMNLHISLHCRAGLFASTTRRACSPRPLCRGVSPIMMTNLALKQRLLRPLSAGSQDIRLTKEGLMKQTGARAEYIDELTKQGLLFPVQIDTEEMYSGDEVLLIELYERLEYLGLP